MLHHESFDYPYYYGIKHFWISKIQPSVVAILMSPLRRLVATRDGSQSACHTDTRLVA